MTLQELFSDPSKWTKRALARDSLGNQVLYSSPHAVCWCLLGGVYKCYNISDQAKITKRIRKHVLTEQSGMLSIGNTYNDDPARTFADIRKLVEDLNL